MSHKNIIIDSDAHFEIDPITRGISNLSPNKMTIIQYDHNSERFTFSMPRFVEGHDMSMSDKVEIHYINIDAGTKEQVCGVFESTDMEVNEEENKLSFSWLISKNATKYVGILSFVVRFSCFDSGDKLAYVWNTGVYSGIAVSKGMYNGEAIVEEYADVLRQWEEKIKGIESNIADLQKNKSDIIKMKTDTVKIHKITDCEPTAFDKLYLYGSAINPKTNPTIKVLGKNLIPYPHARQEYVKNGITFTENGDGTVTVDGTAEDDARYTLIGGNGMRLDYGTYCLSGCPKDGSPTTYYLSVSGTSSGEGFSRDTGTGASFVSDVEGSSIYPQIWIKKGYKARNLVFKPMIEVGSRGTGYEPYVETQKVTIPYKFAKVTDKLVLKDGTVKTIIDGVTEDITNTECGKALRNLHTNFPTTTILCDADCDVTYTVNTKNAYCSLLDEIDILKQAIISLGGTI